MKRKGDGPAGIPDSGNRQEFWFSESMKSVQAGDYTGSVQKIDRAIAAAPNKSEPWLLKGYATYHLGRFDEAVQLFDHVLKLDPGCAKALLLRGLSYIALHRYEEAIRSCDQVLATTPGNSEGWYIRGLALSQLGLYEAAIQCYSQALVLSPGYTDAMQGKKQAEKNYLRQRETLTEVYRDLEKDPQNITLLNRMGKILATVGKFDESLAVYSRTLEIDPGNRDAARGYDNTEKNFRRWADLLPGCDNQEIIALHQKPDIPETPLIEMFSDQALDEETTNLAEKGEIQPSSTTIPTAEFIEESIVRPSPAYEKDRTVMSFPELSIESAVELAANGEYQAAIEMIMLIIIRCPGKVEPFSVLANVYESSGMYLEAVSACDRALQLDPENARLWREKGKMFRKAGRYEAADAAYNMSLDINSENPDILAERGDICRKLGKYHEADQSYRRSLELKPDVARVWYHRAKTLTMLKRYQEAIDACELAISFDNNYIEAMTYKGFLLSKLQRYHDALDVFDIVLRIDPECRDALRIRQSLKGKV